MITVKKVAFQGELAFVSVKSIPKDAKAIKADLLGNDLIVGHSESGHHHVLRGSGKADWQVFQDPKDPLTCYLKLSEDTTVEHLKVGSDAHAAFALGAGLWKISRQQELTPEGWRAVRD